MGCRPVSEKHEDAHQCNSSLFGPNGVILATDRKFSVDSKNKLLVDACLSDLLDSGAAESQVGKKKASRYKLEYNVLANGKEGIVKKGTVFELIL